jgi:hypothetical protein
MSMSVSPSVSASISPSASVSASVSQSVSASVSQSVSASVSLSVSPSSSVSASPSASPSPSAPPAPDKIYITLVEAESDWFITRSGIPQDAPLNEHKRMYWRSKGINDSQLSVNGTEKIWLKNLSGSGSNEISTLWKDAVASQGYTPSNALNANKFTFYTSVTTSP